MPALVALLGHKEAVVHTYAATATGCETLHQTLVHETLVAVETWLG